jgi:hypothetical protein
VDSGRSGGFPAVWTAVPYLPAAISAVILCLLQLFKLLPEWILDDLADFLLFGLQYLPAAVSASMDKNLLTWLLTILSHPQATSNTTVPGIKRIFFL